MVHEVERRAPLVRSRCVNIRPTRSFFFFLFLFKLMLLFSTSTSMTGTRSFFIHFPMKEKMPGVFLYFNPSIVTRMIGILNYLSKFNDLLFRFELSFRNTQKIDRITELYITELELPERGVQVANVRVKGKNCRLEWSWQSGTTIRGVLIPRRRLLADSIRGQFICRLRMGQHRGRYIFFNITRATGKGRENRPSESKSTLFFIFIRLPGIR